MDQVLYRKSSNLPYLGRFGERKTLKSHGISIDLTNVYSMDERKDEFLV